MKKWLDDLDAYWQGLLAREVTEPVSLETGRARQKYLAAIESYIIKASSAGDLDGAVLWRNEKELFLTAKEFPAEDDPAIVPALKQLRTAWRAEMARIGKERAEKTKTLQVRYDAALTQAQTALTQRRRIDDALLVKNRRTEVAAKWLEGIVETTEPAAPAAPAPEEKPLRDAKMQRLAKIEVQDANILTLAKDERIWSDRDVRITKFSPAFEGFRFTQHRAHNLILKFKVVSDGMVYMGCSERWGSTAAPDVAKEFMTQAKLEQKGWVRQRKDEVATTASDMLFLIFARSCKAGEEFSYRTEKYAPPILLLK